MGFVLLGLALVLCRWLDLGPTAAWPWWAILAPFGLAVLWWTWSDNSGRTRRLQDEKYQRLRNKRRERAVESLGRRTRR